MINKLSRFFLLFLFLLSRPFIQAQVMTPEQITKMKDSLEAVYRKFTEGMNNQVADFKKAMGNPVNNKPATTVSAPKVKTEPIRLPAKKITLLAAAKPFSGAQLKLFYKNSVTQFSSRFKKPEEKKKLDTVFANSSPGLLNAMATAAFLNNNYDAAILYMLKILENDSSNVRAASTLGAFCVTAGVPQKAIPVLEYYLKSRPDDPSLLNNCGQAYLALGESTKAEQYLKKAVAQTPWHPEANASLAWIFASKGNKNAAISYAVKSLESAYNARALEVFETLVTDDKEFYEKLPAPADDLYPDTRDQVSLVELDMPSNCVLVKPYIQAQKDLRKDYEDLIKNLTDPLEGKAKSMDLESMMSGAMGQSGSNKISFRRAKAQLMIKKAEKEYTKKIMELQQVFNDFIMNESPRMASQMDAARKGCQDVEDFKRCFCPKENEIKNSYLAKLKAQWNLYRNGYWSATQQYALKLEYWEPMVAGSSNFWDGALSGFSRKTILLTTASKLAGLEIDDLSCCDPATIGPRMRATASFGGSCNGFNLTIPFIVGELNLTCDKFKIKGGEGLVVGYEYEFRSGQSTFMGGPGFNLHDGVVNADAAGLVYLTRDRDGNYVDVGVKGTAEASFMKVGNISYLSAEAEISCGWEAGPGSELTGKVFNQEAIKWQ